MSKLNAMMIDTTTLCMVYLIAKNFTDGEITMLKEMQTKRLGNQGFSQEYIEDFWVMFDIAVKQIKERMCII